MDAYRPAMDTRRNCMGDRGSRAIRAKSKSSMANKTRRGIDHILGNRAGTDCIYAYQVGNQPLTSHRGREREIDPGALMMAVALKSYIKREKHKRKLESKCAW